MKASRFSPPRSTLAFTLLELLVATTVLLVVMVVMLQITGEVGKIWKSSAGKISAFQTARAAFATITRTLERATLNSYYDYIDASGSYRNVNDPGTFAPVKFARASELHFLSGPAAQIVPGASAIKNPGSAIFFQAPLGETDDSRFNSLDRALNATGFYIEYGSTDESLLPQWLRPLGASTKRFRLLQFVEPAEKLKIYTSTATPTYDLTWLQSFKTPVASTQPRARVLAEDVPLLVIRPRLSPEDEKTVASQLNVTVDPATLGSILTPNYHYDSRAWQSGYPAGARVKAASSSLVRANLMRNQVPPVVDVAMVCVDRRSLSRFDQTSDTPPAVLQVPAGLFVDSSKFEADLAAYGAQLDQAFIRYRVFRTSIQIQGAKWANN